MNNSNRSISVIGAGSWGTALALVLAKKGYRVKLWDFSEEHISSLTRDRENRRYLPGCPFPDSLTPVSDLAEATRNAKTICMVVPSHGFRNVFAKMIENLSDETIIVTATKGVENESLMTMSQVMSEELGSKKKLKKIELAVLSGPSFAREVADEVPTAVTIASKNKASSKALQAIFTTSYFRVYTSTDIIGLEVSASLKNVVAIAAGICDGLKFGTNTRAALITRGLVEISRLGQALGAEADTFYGLSGMGDLVLTCTGDLSRNRTVGLKLGEGKNLDQILDEMAMVAEGVKTTKSAYQLALKKNIEMPILDQVYKIIYEDKDCREAVNDLLSREPKAE